MKKPSALAARTGTQPNVSLLADAYSLGFFRPGARRGKTRIKMLAKAFMKFRAAKLAADPSVDTFFNRGESTARFAYFDD